LQTGPAAGVTAPEGMNLVNVGQHIRTFSDTAAVMALMDLVITIDTSSAHLAGALGRPTWVLLRHAPDWRWKMEGQTCAWYPTVRLFRQERFGDWEKPVAAVASALRSFVA
jgi:ADP-heptose:LPS heptosyltransferase